MNRYLNTKINCLRIISKKNLKQKYWYYIT